MKKPIEKFNYIMKATRDWIKEAVKFTATVIALSFAGIGFWCVLGLLYVGSARFVGEWLKLVSRAMN